MATYSPNIYSSDSGQVNYAFTFDTMEESQVKVKVDGTPYFTFAITNYTTAGGGTVVLAAAPPTVGTEVIIYRETNLTGMVATFVSGSAITAANLNNDFTQLRNAIQENRDNASTNGTNFDALALRVAQNEADIAANADAIAANATAIATNASAIYSNSVAINNNSIAISNLSGRVDAQDVSIANIEANFANYWNKNTETISSNDAWSATNNDVASTAAIDNRITARIAAANPTQSFSATSGSGTLTLQPGGDTTSIPSATTSTAGLLSAADKQKLERIQFSVRRNTTFTESFDGTSKDYTVTNKGPKSAFEILLTVAGVFQQPNVDYTYNADSGVVSFSAPPAYSAPYSITYNSVLTDDLSTAAASEDFITKSDIKDAVDQATDFDSLRTLLLAVLQ